MIRRRNARAAALPMAALTAMLVASMSVAAPPDDRAEAPPVQRAAGVTDFVDVGDPGSEEAHNVDLRGATEVASGSVTAGRVTDDFTARQIGAGGTVSFDLAVRPGVPLTIQLRELRPDDGWGESFGYQVHLDGQLVYIRDNETADPGGGPHSSIFIDSNAPEFTRDRMVTLTIEGTSDEPAYFSEIWAYADIERMVEIQNMRVDDKVTFLLGQDYLGEGVFRERLDYITANFADAADANEHVDLGFAVLDYPPNREAADFNANYRLWRDLSREYDLPFIIKQHTEWEGTPVREPDGKGGYFGDLEYQQVLWSPQDQTGPDRDVYTNPNGEVQRLDEFLGEAYEPKYGLSVPNVWGSTPWLTWHHPDLNAYYESKINESLDQVTPLLWEMQAEGDAHRLLPAFSTTTESVYWSKRDNAGVWDVVYTNYNGGVEREDIFADLNPYTIAAAAEEGVTLDPTDGGWSDDEKAWLYRNQSHPQQFFADILYAGLPRERITVSGSEQEFPQDLLRHNVHGEIYSRMQEPYYNPVFPSSAQGIVERARPGGQLISTDGHTPGGFGHMQKMREFGRLANPNLENSVSVQAAEKTLLLRQAFVNGSRYTTPYNWQMSGADEVTGWVLPYLNDLHPFDVVHDAAADGSVSERTVTQQFTAGDVRLTNEIGVQLERVGAPQALQLTLYEGDTDGRVVALKHLAASQVGEDGWTTFDLPIVQLDAGQQYTIEITQLGGAAPAYSYPTAGGNLLHRVGVDLLAERDRSLVMQWRRDAADAIDNIANDLTPADDYASHLLDDARQALTDNAYTEAYHLAMQADSVRYPVLFQSSGTAHLDPFPVSVESTATVDVDVTTFADRRRIELMAASYVADGTDTVTFRVSGIENPTVYVDRSPIGAKVRGGDAVTFTVDLASGHQREVAVLAEGEEPPEPFPSEPPIVTQVSAAGPMFGGRTNTVTSTVENTTNEQVILTAEVAGLPDGWAADAGTATLLPRQSADLEVMVTPPAGVSDVVSYELTVTAEGHDVRDGVHQLDTISVPHPDDAAVTLDAGTLTSPVVEGYDQLAPQHFFDPEFRDYGWVGNPPQARDRGTGTDALRRDIVNDTAERILRLPVPAGDHDVYLLVGDASFPSTPVYVHIDGELVAQSGLLDAGEFTWLRFTASGGADGRAIDLALTSDEGQHWRINAAVVQ